MIRPHRLLLLLFIVTLLSQTTFTIDVVRTLSADYPLKPMTLGSAVGAPWPAITEVSARAAAAGLRVGDRVLAIEGRKPRNQSDFAEAVHAKHPGDRLTVSVERDGRAVDIAAPLTAFSTWWSFALSTLLFMPWLSILLGFWVAAVRPRDLRAWLVLGILLGLRQMLRPAVLDPQGWGVDVAVIVLPFRDLA